MGKNEGGFVNDPVDPGGATNKGVTYQTFTGLAVAVLGISPTWDAFVKLTTAQQKLIAKSYWNSLGGSGISTYKIRNWGIQFQAIEQFWGSGNANMFPLQRAANRFLTNKIAVDGRFGKQTLNALNEVVNQEALFHAVYEERLNFYDAIIAHRPSLNKYRNGWQKRLMQGYRISCKLMGYQPKAELHDRLIRWSPKGTRVLPFDIAVPQERKLNGQKFNDKGFTGAIDGELLSIEEQTAGKITDDGDEKKNFA